MYEGEILSKTASHNEQRNENTMDKQKNTINVESMIKKYSPRYYKKLNDTLKIVAI